MAADTGVYRPREHRAMAVGGRVRVPGGDFDGYVETHVRRLEALRRAGIVERLDGWTAGRLDGDRWTIPADYEARAMAYDSECYPKLVSGVRVLLSRLGSFQAATSKTLLFA